MTVSTLEQIDRHLKTHSKRSAEDCSAVDTIKYVFKSNGKINTDFSSNDKWPNVDGRFELVPDPDVCRQPTQNFFVQIKGTTVYRESENGEIKYQLQSLAFPAYIVKEVTLDPGLIILVLNPCERHNERIFWKYVSPEFLASIDFTKDSSTITFTKDDEILNTDESINEFTKKLTEISEKHSFLKQLETRQYTVEDVLKVVLAHSKNICDAITAGNVLNQTRDNISRKILGELSRLCESVLILNGLQYYSPMSLRTAYDCSLLSIKTKFLATFIQGLRYIGLRVPEDGQNERLMLKYYDFLWKIRQFMHERYDVSVLENLEEFPRAKNDEEDHYNALVASAIDSIKPTSNPWKSSRYYIQKKNTFYVGRERYFEITLQLANKYATKYNRLTVYTKSDISSNYSIQIGFEEAEIHLWEDPSKIKVVTNWRVSVEPAALNKFALILKRETKISSQYKEYGALMDFLTKTGMNLLDLVDLSDAQFNALIDQIYKDTNTVYFKEILVYLHKTFHDKSTVRGRNIVRYILLHLKEAVIENLLPNEDDEKKFYSNILNLSVGCHPFDNNPVLYNLPKHSNVMRDVMRAAGSKLLTATAPYLRIKNSTDITGEIYFPKCEIEPPNSKQTISQYNSTLREYDKNQGLSIKEDGDLVYIDGYVNNTVSILQTLLSYTNDGNDGQAQLNQRFVKDLDDEEIDISKKNALSKVFVDSRVLMIYGAAGTGKTTLMNYISKLMEGRSKLFLTKTHTALENLERRIDTDKRSSHFDIVDRLAYSRNRAKLDYDLIFIDECSTIDNRAMLKLLERVGEESLVVLAGDIYQIESIDFGNWFFYAKDILPERSIVELTSTWRTQIPEIKGLWEAVRFKKPLITEMLAIDGPFSEDISKKIFTKTDPDEVVLCLNYDGKFGLNSINSYFQDANPSKETFVWQEWKYKVGDPILFNDSKRFPMLYNNLKGEIVDIEQGTNFLRFTIDVGISLTSLDVRGSDLELIDFFDESTRVAFYVQENDGGTTDEERETSRMRSIVPFQLAYAVSIHKAQGLEYNSIKIVIPNSNSERISHGIFYTAITRTKDKLKIYWSADTMKKIINSFNESEKENRSLALIKKKLSETE